MRPLILQILVRGVLLLAFAGATAWFLRRRPAALRALVWTAALAGLLVLPMATRLLPAWSLPVLPAVEAGPAPAADIPPVRPAESGQTKSSPAEMPPAPAPGGPRSVRHTGATAAASTTTEPAGRGTAPGWPAAAMLVWAAGALLLLGRLGRSHLHIARAVRRGSGPGDPSWATLTTDVRRLFGIRRAVRIRMSPEVSVPAAAGVLRPVLLLPLEANEWPASERRTVVLHELAHVARWDALAQLVGQISCAFYWFLPLVWYAERRAAAEREAACDDIVLNAGTRASEYAESLLRLVRMAGGAELQPAALAMARPSRIRERIAGILDPAVRRERMKGRLIMTMFALAGGVVLMVAAATPVQRPAVPPTPAVSSVPSVSAVPAVPTAPAVPTVPAVPAAAAVGAVGAVPAVRADSQFCGDLTSSSSSIHEDNDHRRVWTVKLRGENCRVDFRAEGNIEFNQDFTDIKSISQGGFLQLDVTQDGVRRELEIRPEGGALKYSWKVDGTARPWDAGAKAWFATFLIELDRRTAVAVDVRLPKLLQQGGVPAVLQETGLMSSDWARTTYYMALLDRRKLSPSETRDMLHQAAAMTESDFHAAQLLTRVTQEGLTDPGVRAAFLEVANGIDSDFHQAQILDALLDRGKPTEAEVQFVLDHVRTMKSDFHKAQVLDHVLVTATVTESQRADVARIAAGMESSFHTGQVLGQLTSNGASLGPEERAAFLEAVGRMDSDHTKAEILTGIMGQGRTTPAEIKLILEAAGSIESDFNRTQVLDQLLDQRAVTSEDLLQVVTLAQAMDSDFNKGNVLAKVAGHARANDKVRQAVRRAADDLGDFQRRQVLETLGGKEI